MHKFYEYLEDYNVRYVLDSFLDDKENGIDRQNWSPLIPANQYQQALSEFVKYGKFMRFPTNKIYQWMGIIMKNTAILMANTELSGHEAYFPTDEVIDVFFYEDEEKTEYYENNSFELMDFLDKVGLYDWMVMPDDTYGWSDFGIEPIAKIINEYNESLPPEKVIVLINKILDVTHMRGDLSSIFIEGGKRTLTNVSYGYNESVSGKKTLSEMAYPSSFNIEEFKSIRSFKDRIKYCSQRLKILGTGSSRRAYKVDDEKVLKIAINRKGIAQNETETDYGISMYQIAPVIFDFDDEKFLWIESEFARPINQKEFRDLTGYDFNKVCEAFVKYSMDRKGKKYNPSNLTQEEYNSMWDDEGFISDMFRYIGDYDIPYGDLLTLKHYGVVMRKGKPHVVLIDTGLNNNVWENYYGIK